MPRQLRAEQTRATIIRAAAELFDQKGYERTSLSDIVAHAKVTKGALYFHFAAKEDLAQAIMELQSQAAHQVTSDVDERGCSSLEALIRITYALTRLAVEGPIIRAGQIITRKLLGAAREYDIQPDVDVHAVAHSMVCFFVGTRVAGRSLEPLARLPRRTTEMWHLLIRGLVPVHRRPRYLSLATRLEREIAVV